MMCNQALLKSLAQSQTLAITNVVLATLPLPNTGTGSSFDLSVSGMAIVN